MSDPVAQLPASLTEHPAPVLAGAAATLAPPLPDLECPLRGHVMQVGDYLVGEAPDPRLSGHPCIRY